MTEKDLDEFEKEFGFKLLPTGFNKPLSEITKEEYRERIEYLYNAIMNDDSNEEDDFLMESFVQMSLREYDTLKFNNEYLKRRLKEEQESHSEDVAQAKKEINDLAEKIDQYKKHILERNCRFLDVENYSLEQCLDIDSWTYGMNYKDDLLNLGFTKQDMDGFIADKYEELVKEKEGKEDD